MLAQGVRACVRVRTRTPLSMVCAGDPRRALVLLAHTPTMVYAEEYVPARASEASMVRGSCVCAVCTAGWARSTCSSAATLTAAKCSQRICSSALARLLASLSVSPPFLALFDCLFVVCLFVLVGGMFAT